MQAQSADGVIHDFPDGTNIAVIDRVMKSYAADGGKQAATATPSTDTPSADAYAGTGAEGMKADEPSPIATAATEAAKSTEPLQTPYARDLINKMGPIGQQIVNPALDVGTGVVGAAHAGMAGLSEAAMQLLGAKGGRDALALLASAPMAAGERMSPHPESTAVPPPRPQYVSERVAPDVSQLDTRNAMQALIQHDVGENPPPLPDRGVANQSIADIGKAQDIDTAIAAAGKAAQASPAPYTPVTATQVAARDGIGIDAAFARARDENAAATTGPVPEEPPPIPPLVAAEVPGPESAGAAASREGTAPGVADISTSDMKANRRRAEMDELVAPPEANNTTIHVPGSFPTLAERSGDPNLSQYENLLRERVPQAFVGEGKILTENNKARVNEYDNNTIPDPTLNTMRSKRNAQWVADSDAILPTAKPIDFNPAFDWVQGQLSNPRIQENDAVRSVLEDFRDRLADDNGDLKTDPAAAWGIHDNLQNQLSEAKDPLKQSSAAKFAESQVLQAKRLVDAALNVATDNRFQTALDNYAEASKAINAGVIFNDFRPKLTNMTGEIQAQRFHQFVVNLAKERGDPGIDPTMDISDAGMRSMLNIDADLKRAKLIKLGAPSGSQTNLLGALAESAGMDAAHAIVGKIPLAGGALVAGQKYFAQRKLIADAGKHIAPPEGGYRYPEEDGAAGRSQSVDDPNALRLTPNGFRP